MTAAFELHPSLAADTFELGHLPLCRVLLMNDATYAWMILVPQRPGLREIHELDEADQMQLMRESCLVARAMASMFEADKMNVAALGNMVPQLHIHHIARHMGDPAWPAPVWGKAPARSYASGEVEKLLARFTLTLDNPAFVPAGQVPHKA